MPSLRYFRDQSLVNKIWVCSAFIKSPKTLRYIKEKEKRKKPKIVESRMIIDFSFLKEKKYIIFAFFHQFQEGHKILNHRNLTQLKP